MEFNDDNKKLTFFLADALGILPDVWTNPDAGDEQVEVLRLRDAVSPDKFIHCSLGLSDYENLNEIDGKKQDIRIELLMGEYSHDDMATTFIIFISRLMIKHNYNCTRGSVFFGTVEHYLPGSDMKHCFFTTPYLWQDKLSGLSLDSKAVTFLHCIPISDRELEYHTLNGYEALTTLLQKNNADIHDYKRRSII